MSYDIEFEEQFLLDLKRHRKCGNIKLLKKIEAFVSELSEHPRTGIGKPEQLKGYKAERWSRRIDSKHRLVYEIRDTELIVIAITAYGHYGEK